MKPKETEPQKEQKEQKQEIKVKPNTLYLSPFADMQLKWICDRTPNEVSSIGILAANPNILLVERFVIQKQVVSIASVDPDMDDTADLIADLYAKDQIEPWRTRLWCHTHPTGVNGPSGTDNATMADPTGIGSWPWAIMLIRTKAGVYIARLDLAIPSQGLPVSPSRHQIPLTVETLWFANAILPTQSDLFQWERDFATKVKTREPFTVVTSPTKPQTEHYPQSLIVDNPLQRTEHDYWPESKSNWPKDCAQLQLARNDPEPEPEAQYELALNDLKEYREVCLIADLNPESDEVFEQYFGFKREDYILIREIGDDTDDDDDESNQEGVSYYGIDD